MRFLHFFADSKSEVCFANVMQRRKRVFPSFRYSNTNFAMHLPEKACTCMMLALEQRKDEDERTLGELFFFFYDELSDITFSESFRIILTAMFESIYSVFHVTEAQIDMFIEEFVNHLPLFLQEALAKTSTAS